MGHRSVEERRLLGAEARAAVPRSSHAEWVPSPNRPDPVRVIDAENTGRVNALVPIRHGRMRRTPFAFYRGAAGIMAGDLANTLVSGIDVQLCGDAHLSNFGVFASPARRLVFDINDFDETLLGPWEWDVKRLAASLVIAGRNNRFGDVESRKIARRSVRAYQRAMTRFAQMSTLEVWYTRLKAKDIEALAKRPRDRKTVARTMSKAERRDSVHALSELAVEVDGAYRIKSDPPKVVPLRDGGDIMDPAVAGDIVRDALDDYQDSLSGDRRTLLSRYRLVDVAHKVVGVGSVGTRCFIALLEGRDRHDLLFLEAKEATSSVLEEHLAPSVHEHHGQRVVEGQRLIQAASDVFLGWTSGRLGRDFYLRQLRVVNGLADVEDLAPDGLSVYARLCGWTLARGHARSGDPVAIAAYMGKGANFPDAVAEFACRYADQNDRDHEELLQAVSDGRLATAEG